jgi:endoglucanase
MKKLLLLLILSFFSAQGYAASCPDGSEPVKSLSADGTYFVYKCSNNSDNVSNSNNSATTTSKSSTPSTNSSSVWKDNGVSDNVAKQLSRVGVNSAINYMGETYYDTINSSKINNNIDKVKQVFNDGFSHYTYVISNTNKFYLEKCVEVDGWNEEKDMWNIIKSDFSTSCLDKDSISSMSKSVKKQILEVLLEIPDAVFVISLKSGFEFRHYLPNGMPQNIWLTEFEQKKSVRDGFNEQWRLIAEELKDIPEDNLAFNLLNEPEFEYFKGGNARESWEKWITNTVDVIRDISPDRTIIIEGVYKSLFARHNGPANVIRPIPRKNIVYGFHYYPFFEWMNQDTYQDEGGRGKGVPMPSLNKPKNDFRQLVDYSNSYKVPVAVTEIAVVNPCEGYGPLQKDITKYAEMAYEALVPNGIGMTFWALESLMSPYKRIEGRCYDIFDKDLIPDKQLFKALRLTPITTEAKQPSKAVVDALQIILDNEVKKEAEKKAKEHTIFDGRYSFTLSRHHEDEGIKRLGNGYIEINNGIMTVEKEGRTLDTGSIDLYDSFEGQIDKKGNIIFGSLNINIMFGEEGSSIVSLKGNKDSQFEGAWNDDWDVILKLGKKESVKIVETNELFATIEASDEFDLSAIKASDEFDGKYAFKLISNPPNITKHQIGSGYFEIKSGFITVSTKDRVLIASSNKFVTNKYYNNFEGRIEANGEIKANFFFNPCANGSKCYVQEEGEYNIAINDDKNITLLGNIKTHKLTGEFTKGSGPDIVKIIFELEDRN